MLNLLRTTDRQKIMNGKASWKAAMPSGSFSGSIDTFIRKVKGKNEKIMRSMSWSTPSTVCEEEDEQASRGVTPLTPTTENRERVQQWILSSCPPSPKPQIKKMGGITDFEKEQDSSKAKNLQPNCVSGTLFHPDFADWRTCEYTHDACEQNQVPSFVEQLDDAHNSIIRFFEGSLKAFNPDPALLCDSSKDVLE